MEHNRAKLLYTAAGVTANNFSNPDRALNGNKEIFEVGTIHPLSELTAIVVFDKSSGKKAMAFYYWINSQGGHWRYFFPTDSHVLGMAKVAKYLEKIEQFNYGKNL